MLTRTSPLKVEQSNYTTEPNYAGLDPIIRTDLYYENTPRYTMDSDFYALQAPILFCPASPGEVGYHVLPYALQVFSMDPTGGTNYSKLANVSIQHYPSSAAVNAAQGISQSGEQIITSNNGNPMVFNQTWAHVLVAQNKNIVRVAHGSIGQPIL